MGTESPRMSNFFKVYLWLWLQLWRDGFLLFDSACTLPSSMPVVVSKAGSTLVTGFCKESHCRKEQTLWILGPRIPQRPVVAIGASKGQPPTAQFQMCPSHSMACNY